MGVPSIGASYRCPLVCSASVDEGDTGEKIDIHVRPARASDPKDRVFLRAMAPRLETGMPPWIPPGALAAVERSVLGALDARREGEAILVTEDAQGRRLGFVYATTTRGGLSDEPLDVSEFAVAADAEGRGVARALMDAAER